MFVAQPSYLLVTGYMGTVDVPRFVGDKQWLQFGQGFDRNDRIEITARRVGGDKAGKSQAHPAVWGTGGALYHFCFLGCPSRVPLRIPSVVQSESTCEPLGLLFGASSAKGL